jgi:hypothetical protein
VSEVREMCPECQGNGEVITDWDRYLHTHDGDKGDEAVAECAECNGEGWLEPAFRPSGDAQPLSDNGGQEHDQ